MYFTSPSVTHFIDFQTTWITNWYNVLQNWIKKVLQ